MATFHYESSIDPRVAGTLSDLMLRRGDIAAHAAQQNGAIWGGAIQNIGQMVGALPGQIALAKRADLQDRIGALQLQGAQQAAGDDQRLRAAYQQSGGDPAQMRAILASSGGLTLQHDQTLQAMEQHQAERHNAITSQIGLALHDRLRPDDPTNNLVAMQEALDAAEHHKLITPEQAQQFGAMASADPTKIPEVARSWAGLTAAGRAEIEKTITNKPGEVITSRWDDKPVGTPLPEKKPDYTINGQRFSGATGEPIGETVPPQHVAAPKAYQHVDKLLDGKPATLLLDPAPGGKLYDLSGKEIDNASARVKPIPAASIQIANSSGTKDDAEAIADAIENGDQPPTTTGLFRLAGPVRAALAKRGFDLTKANLDFEATKKHLATLNGSKITTMRSSIATATDSLDVIDSLAKQWDAGRFPILNKANLTLAKSGVYGKGAAEIATQLEGQITDVVSELGQVYMGGNSPTDHALKLAEKNLSAAWDKDVLLSMTKLARTNLKIRNNSITNSGAVLSGGPAEGAAPPTPTHRFNPATGKVEPIS